MIIPLLNQHLQEFRLGEKPRKYLGASSLGNPCDRAIWYGYTGAPSEIESKILMTFEIGKQLEKMLMEMIDAFPANVVAYRPNAVNNYLKVTHPEVPELQGHLDALINIDGVKYVLEIKTANSASFAKVRQVGVRQWRPQYYEQIQLYLGMCSINSAIMLVINKDSSELYEEVIEFNEAHYRLLVEKAKMILYHQEPPAKINKSPSFYVCKMCSYRKHCHGIR